MGKTDFFAKFSFSPQDTGKTSAYKGEAQRHII
jgi:hypothetical protein